MRQLQECCLGAWHTKNCERTPATMTQGHPVHVVVLSSMAHNITSLQAPGPW